MRRWTPCASTSETVQPIREKTGGSTFKNPEGHSARKALIGKAGCRGIMIGGAQMSPMHCNFMINTGQATGYELEYLGETVRSRVLEHSGVMLQWEIKRLGKFMPGYEVRDSSAGRRPDRRNLPGFARRLKHPLFSQVCAMLCLAAR